MFSPYNKKKWEEKKQQNTAGSCFFQSDPEKKGHQKSDPKNGVFCSSYIGYKCVLAYKWDIVDPGGPKTIKINSLLQRPLF